MKTKLLLLPVLAAATTCLAFQTEHNECMQVTQGDLGGWTVKNVCRVPIDVGLVWRPGGSNSSWTVRLVRRLNAGFQVDTPNCGQCVMEVKSRSFYSSDRTADSLLRPDLE
jgi:hypothetical protein